MIAMFAVQDFTVSGLCACYISDMLNLEAVGSFETVCGGTGCKRVLFALSFIVAQMIAGKTIIDLTDSGIIAFNG
jgi:hypothetical protein